MLLPIHTRTVAVFDNISLDAEHFSSPEDIRNCVGYAVHFVWEAGVSNSSSTVVVQATNDDPGVVASPIWTDVSSSLITGTDGSLMVNVERAMYTFVRVGLTPTGGSGGTMRAKLSVKIQ